MTRRTPSPAIRLHGAFAATAMGFALFTAACSSQQAYGAGQAWQRLECSKINDAQERSRCMASSSTSYEEYKRQAEAAKSGK
jgi:hypothetical protein